MDKYYTPELEEFYVGFECELIDNDKTHKWFPIKCSEETLYDVQSSHYNARVKYLSKEDIESLGFTITKDSEEVELSLESKRYIGGPSAGDDYKIIILYGLDNKEMWIYKKCNNGYEYDLFKGLIKNKSELIKLLKQLQIG